MLAHEHTHTYIHSVKKKKSLHEGFSSQLHALVNQRCYHPGIFNLEWHCPETIHRVGLQRVPCLNLQVQSSDPDPDHLGDG